MLLLFPSPRTASFQTEGENSTFSDRASISDVISMMIERELCSAESQAKKDLITAILSKTYLKPNFGGLVKPLFDQEKDDTPEDKSATAYVS